ncbi:hypothetical protein PQR53_00085 [Paraburkholderia fungorum]
MTFTAAPNLVALAQSNGITNVTQLRADDGIGKGLAVYSVNLNQ